MKRKITAVSLAAFLVLPQLTPTTASAEDISKHWAATEMNYLIQKDILKGDQYGNYLPKENVTRAQFATFIVRALDLPLVTTPANYKDVKDGQWFYDSINIASYYGIIKGDTTGKFNPNANITREEMAVMIKRAMDYLGITSTSSSVTFSDQSKIAPWAVSSIQQVASVGIIEGNPDRSFAPKANATRAEASVILYRLLNPNDVGIKIETTSYSHQFSDVVSRQAKNSPKVDGAGKFTATDALVAYYLNPSNFKLGTPEYYQFLKLSTPVKNLSENVVNEKILYGKGILAGTANSFINAGNTHQINEIYLISHALHETDLGRSPLANGIEVGLDINGNPEMVTDENASSLHSIKKTYNLFGIGAIDSNPNKYGSERAYKEGWFSVDEAIMGGAKFVKEKYIGVGQDTLYEMRWNPSNPTVHQYATHVMWALIQAQDIAEYYEIIDAQNSVQLVFDVPVYAGQPASSPLPAGPNQYAVLTEWQGAEGVMTTSGVNFRTYPKTGIDSNIISKLEKGTKISVLGSNGGWYKVRVNGTEGWVSFEYVELTNVLKVSDMAEYAIKTLNVRSEPNTSSSKIDSVKANSLVVGVKDSNGNFVKENNWYKVIVNGKTGWVSGDYVSEVTSESK
ncbi:S-layer homology domain-containing protein [Ureibacillus sp. MALMAid1270]|uniref:S-layer homology domain-containing protein n=1 Tax=Ureibacillus sp. MALMAid1270 TaxID=3411629 RepID=UPI003BA49CBE